MLKQYSIPKNRLVFIEYAAKFLKRIKFTCNSKYFVLIDLISSFRKQFKQTKETYEKWLE
jgi:hypothetical protein